MSGVVHEPVCPCCLCPTKWGEPMWGGDPLPDYCLTCDVKLEYLASSILLEKERRSNDWLN